MRATIERLTLLGGRCSRARAFLNQIPESVSRIVAVDGPATELEFIPRYSLPVVNVDCFGGNLRFLIDNGADEVYLRKELATKMGLRLSNRRRGTFAGGRVAWLYQSILPDLVLGSVRVATIPVVVLEEIGRLDGRQIDGIIGSQLLSQFITTLDFERNVLRLERTRSALSNGQHVEGRIFGSHIFVIPIRVEGERGNYFVDSGGTFGVAPDAKGWNRMSKKRVQKSEEGVSTAGHRIRYDVIHDVALSVADTHITGVTAVGGIFPKILSSLPVKIRGIISYEVLSRFNKVIFDFDQPQIVFQ